jgi:hypothetical protein
MEARGLRGDGPKQLARQLVGAWDCAFPPRSCIPSFARRNRWENKKRRAVLLLLPPPGGSTRSSAIPARPPGTVPGVLGTARFTKPLELKKRRSARCPRVAALVQLHPPPNHRPGQPAGGSHALPWASPGAGWWLVGDRGHRHRKPEDFGRPEGDGPIARGDRQPFRAPH